MKFCIESNSVHAKVAVRSNFADIAENPYYYGTCALVVATVMPQTGSTIVAVVSGWWVSCISCLVGAVDKTSR